MLRRNKDGAAQAAARPVAFLAERGPAFLESGCTLVYFQHVVPVVVQESQPTSKGELHLCKSPST
jgi:hypothetical protein